MNAASASGRCAVAAWLVLWGAACGGGSEGRGIERSASEHDESSGDDLAFPDEASSGNRHAAPSASEDVQRGEELLASGDVDAAKQAFMRAIQRNPRDVRAHFNLGLVHEVQNDEATAEREYRAALAIDGEFVEGMNNLGALLREQGKLDEAEELLQHAARLRPNDADVQTNFALVLEEKGDMQGAAAAWQQVVRVSPRDATARANLGLLWLRLNEPQRALAEFQRALPLAAGDEAALQAIGNGARRAGDPRLAVTAMQQAIEAHQGRGTPALLSELALAWLASGERERAELTLKEAISADPQYATAHFLLASMLAGRRAFREAITYFERYLAIEPNGPHAAEARERMRVARTEMRRRPAR